MTYNRFASMLQEASEKHHTYEVQHGPGDWKDDQWPLWYATYILTKYSTEFDSPHSSKEETESILDNVVL